MLQARGTSLGQSSMAWLAEGRGILQAAVRARRWDQDRGQQVEGSGAGQIEGSLEQERAES